MLKSSKVVGFIATSAPEVSKRFYNEVLGLPVVDETPYAIVVEAAETVIRIQITDLACAPPYTALGWEVERIDETVAALSKAGVRFERYAGLQQDDWGVWTTRDGARVAWFKDPDGNLLSLTQSG